MTVKFTKVQSVGNDFVLIEHEPGLDYPSIARNLCRRHFGVGSDGLLVVDLGSDVPDSIIELRMFNPDGTEDFCGNGLRCAALYSRAKGEVVGDRLEIRQLGRIIPIRFDGDDIFTKLDPGTYEPARVPIAVADEFVEQLIEVKGHEYIGHALSTGSTHLVIPVDFLPLDDEFFEISPALEHHPLFPERTSIMWMQKVSTGHIKLRIWERGAGETQGCGTGSTAAAIVYARKWGYQGEIRVQNPGGDLFVSLKNWDDHPVIRGRAQMVFEGVTCESRC